MNHTDFCTSFAVIGCEHSASEILLADRIKLGEAFRTLLYDLLQALVCIEQMETVPARKDD